MASPVSVRGNSRRVLATLGVLGAIGALATAGSYSLFTDSVSAGPQTVASGTVDIALGTGQPNRLTVGASDVAPGDTIQRAVDITNAGTIGFASVSLTTSATTTSVLDTDATNGLQMAVDRCSVPWTEGGAAPAYTYACPGVRTIAVASRPVIGANLGLGALASLTPAGTDHLLVTLTLPTSADNTFQTQTSTIAYTFDAQQRAGTSR